MAHGEKSHQQSRYAREKDQRPGQVPVTLKGGRIGGHRKEKVRRQRGRGQGLQRKKERER